MTLLLWETNDVAKHLGLSASGVLMVVRAGKLSVYAKSVRGVRYFLPEDVEKLRQDREAHPPQRGGR